MRHAVRVMIAIPAIAFALLAYVYVTLPDVRSLRTACANRPSGSAG